MEEGEEGGGGGGEDEKGGSYSICFATETFETESFYD